MAEPGSFQQVPLYLVDLEDQTFVVPGGDLTKLLASIQEVGLLNSPWLRARPDNRWQVVAGLKRLRVATQLGWQSIWARTLPAVTPDSHCLLIALHDNAFTRGFHLWEQAVLSRRLLAHWNPATVAAQFLPYLGLCARGHLALTAAALLAQWPAADRAAALPYLSGLPFSQSKQEQFLEDVDLLARREGVTPREILSRKELGQYLAEPALNPTERAEAVRRLLRGWVTPRLNAALAAFGEALGRLGLQGHPRIRLQPPPAFEGPDFRLEIKFQDAQELAELVEKIARLSGREEFSSLTRL
jgi:ParB family chromosome partitioning protein